MKPRISPDEYRSILESLELDTLYLTELSSKFKEDFVTSNLVLGIEEKYHYEQASSILKVFYFFKLSAKDETKEDYAISFQAKYTIRYKLTKDVVISKDFMKVFTDLTLGMLLWPYFREIVHNTVYRMGMPPLVLPLKRR
jgi:preprotein translocase subunit SecB